MRHGGASGRHGSDDGLTLVEMLVSMALLAVVMTMLTTLVVTTSRTFTKDRAATDSVNIATVGMNEISRNLRAGTEIRQSGASNIPVFTVADNESVTVHAYIDADSMDPRPVKVTFSINSDRELVELRQPANVGTGPYWTFVAPTDPTATSKTVTRQITPRTSPDLWLFSYYAANDPTTPAVDESSTPMSVPAGGLSEAQRRAVATVQVRLSVQADITERAQPVVLVNRIGLPNLGIDLTGADT